jgi:hypothetical protein
MGASKTDSLPPAIAEKGRIDAIPSAIRGLFGGETYSFSITSNPFVGSRWLFQAC